MPLGAQKELDAHLVLKAFETVADGGLGQVEVLRRLRDVAAAHQLQKDFDVLVIHGKRPPFWAYFTLPAAQAQAPALRSESRGLRMYKEG